MNIKYKFTVSGILLGLLIALGYIKVTPHVFESLSEVLILRANMETPFKVQEESRNRWIWLRDGLALQKNVMDEKLLQAVLEEIEQEPGEKLNLKGLRKKASIEFTGADEFLFKINVRDTSKENALKINQLIFHRLKDLYLVRPVEVFNSSLTAFSEHYPKQGRDNTVASNINQLKALHGWEQAQREASFQVILSPQVSPEIIWPKKTAVAILGVLLGLFIGVSVDLFLSRSKTKLS